MIPNEDEMIQNMTEIQEDGMFIMETWVLEWFTAYGHKSYWNGSERMGIKGTGMGHSEWAYKVLE